MTGNDIALEWSATSGAADVVLVDNDLKTEAGLRTAVLLSLFTNRRAESSDTLPDGEDDRQGWWADEFSDTAGDQIGSRLWLLRRSKRTAPVLLLAIDYAKEALKWLKDDRVAAEVTVEAEFVPAGLALTVTIVRPTGDVAAFRFGDAWSAEESRV